MSYNSNGNATHVLVMAESNLTKVSSGFSYSIVSVNVSRKDGTMVETQKIVWHDEPQGSGDEIIALAESGEMLGTKIDPLDAAVEFLRELLQNGPVLVGEGEKQAKAVGITTRALKAAKKTLGVFSKKREGAGQFSPSDWHLPGSKPK